MAAGRSSTITPIKRRPPGTPRSAQWSSADTPDSSRQPEQRRRARRERCRCHGAAKRAVIAFGARASRQLRDRAVNEAGSPECRRNGEGHAYVPRELVARHEREAWRRFDVRDDLEHGVRSERLARLEVERQTCGGAALETRAEELDALGIRALHAAIDAREKLALQPFRARVVLGNGDVVGNAPI